MIATAIEFDKPNAPLSGCFGKAKYFAFFDGKEIKILKNPHKTGWRVKQWLNEKGVTHLLMKEQGKRPCAFKSTDTIELLYPTLQQDVRVNEMVKLYFKNFTLLIN